MIAVRHQAQGAVDAAGRSAAAAEQSNANAVASERPWVGIVFGIQEFEKGKNPRFAVQYLNTGRRPAKVTAARARPYTYRVFPEHPFYPQEPSNIASAAIIVPNGSLIHNDPLPFPSDTELAELRKFPREKTYYLYAAIDYEDVLTHAKYWTHGCLQFYPEYGGPFGSWINCPFYNEVGDEKP
jgi:hypothetical protein